jgi:hypothetical protein
MLAKHFNVLSHVVWTKPNDPGFDGWKGKMNKEVRISRNVTADFAGS